jgi:integrase
MRLKDVALRNAKAKKKPYRLNDGHGLYLMVHPNGRKYWQFRFRFDDKEKLLSLGVYPEVTLVEARDSRDDARKLLRAGKDPTSERKALKKQARALTENKFAAVAMEWHKNRAAIWTARHATKMLKRLETDIFPFLGDVPISTIAPVDLLAVLRKIENRGAAHTAHRMQQIVGQIFRYAVATGKAPRDITGDLRGALQSVKKVNHARLSANELPEFLQLLSTYDGERQTRNAVRLLMLTFVRTGELRGAKKSEFDWNNAEWRIPAERMKMRSEHVVPLSQQAAQLFKAQIEISGTSEFVFPNRNRPTAFMSENTILYAIYRMGYHTRTTAHGFRGTASTILHESGFNSDIVERQLAHRDKNAVRSSYNHAVYLPERRKMMQWWADYLDSQLQP